MSNDDGAKKTRFSQRYFRYGNNAIEMETTAKYDAKTDEFVINTPSTLAQKYWITNGAIHAHYCVVFASLILADGANEGDAPCKKIYILTIGRFLRPSRLPGSNP